MKLRAIWNSSGKDWRGPASVIVAELRAEARGELGGEVRLVERHDRGAATLLFGPHDGRAVAGERQHGERAGGEKMLHGAPAMRPRMRDGGDDADLRIGPAHAFDAGGLSQAASACRRRRRAARRISRAACELRVDREVRRRIVADGLRREHLDGGRSREHRAERADEGAILDQIGAGLARPELVIEAEEMRSKRRIERAVGDLDRGDGLRRCRQAPAKCQARREGPGSRRTAPRRGRHRTVCSPLRRLGIDQRHAEALAARARPEQGRASRRQSRRRR